MKSYITEEVETLTDEELDNLITTLTQTKENRKKEKYKKLIENFQEAWYALRKENIVIYYYDDNNGNEIYLDINNFSFE